MHRQHRRYRDGPFHQYVHMIEQSANGVLFEELDRIADLNAAIRAGHSPYGQRGPVTVHVVKPHHPIPLDPDLFLGRIDAATLVVMGYRDARRYLDTMDSDRGVGLTPEATRMEEPGVRVFWRKRHAGPLGRVKLVAEVADAAAFVAGSPREARLVGRVQARGIGDAMLRDGRAALEGGALVYEGTFDVDGRELALTARREAPHDGSLGQRLRSLQGLRVELHEGTGGALVDEGAVAPHTGGTAPLPLPIVMDPPSLRRRLATAASFERAMAAELLVSPERRPGGRSRGRGTLTTAPSALGVAAATQQAPEDLRVIAFNTAVGNPQIKTLQRAFLELPFYRDVIEGRTEAPILALQEVGPQQAAALKDAAANGRFRVVHIQRPGQGNALLIPERFQLLSRRSRYLLAGQLRGIVAALWRAARGAGRPDHRQLGELRMFNQARLRDTRSGRVFTVFNTHLSADPHLRVVQARDFFGRAHAARRHGPVIVAGDLNTRAGENPDPQQRRADAAVRALFPPLQDMGATAVDPRRPNIDYVLAAGFSLVRTRLYTGDSLQLPGLPTAEVISDHYAEEVVLRFA